MDPNPVVESHFRVRYAETDAMGVVYHANYLVWFEVGRGDYFRALGQDYGLWEQQGYLLPVSEAYARYHASARYGDPIVVRTRVKAIRSRSITLAYEACHAQTGQRLATGWTKHICVDRQGHVTCLPDAMVEAVEA